MGQDKERDAAIKYCQEALCMQPDNAWLLKLEASLVQTDSS